MFLEQRIVDGQPEGFRFDWFAFNYCDRIVADCTGERNEGKTLGAVRFQRMGFFHRG